MIGFEIHAIINGNRLKYNNGVFESTTGQFFESLQSASSEIANLTVDFVMFAVDLSTGNALMRLN